MSFITGLHGTVAALLICSLLLVDEAGVPLPFAPNEGLLLLTGVLVAGGAFPLWLILPVEFACMLAGMIAGYIWARAVGESGLRAVASRLHATAVYERTQAMLRSANPVGIGLARLIPGLRPYATLVSGAAGINLRTFLLAAIPALVIWEVVLVLAGMVVGLPVIHLMGRFERIALRGVILIALGAVTWLAIRDASPDRRAGVAGITPRLRPTLALLVDTAVIMGAVSGLFALGQKLWDIPASGWIQLGVGAIFLIGLLLLGRSTQTPGEILFETHYWHYHHAPHHSDP